MSIEELDEEYYSLGMPLHIYQEAASKVLNGASEQMSPARARRVLRHIDVIRHSLEELKDKSGANEHSLLKLLNAAWQFGRDWRYFDDYGPKED